MDVSAIKENQPEIRFIKQDSIDSIKKRNEIISENHVLLRQIQIHDIEKARETIKKIINTLQSGLADTFDVLHQELKMMNSKVIEDLDFLTKHSKEMTKDQANLYHDEVLIQVTTALDYLKLKYISDVSNSIRYGEFGEYKLQELNKRKSFFGKMFQKSSIKSLVVRTGKLQKHIIKLETLKKAGHKVKKILKENKRYYDNFELLAEQILIFNLTLINNAHESADVIEKAVNEFDMISSYQDYAEDIRLILQDDEVKALKELTKLIKEIEKTSGKSKKLIEKINYAS